jgi:hypothetical protein
LNNLFKNGAMRPARETKRAGHYVMPWNASTRKSTTAAKRTSRALVA